MHDIVQATPKGQHVREPVQVLTGRQLDRLARKSPPLARAILCDQLRDGTAQVTNLTERQARRLARANYGYANAIHRATREQFAAVLTGRLKLYELVRRLSQPSDSQLDRMVKDIGAERVMAALDRATAPQRVAAE